MVSGLGAKPHNLSKQNEAIARMLGGQSKPMTSSNQPLVANSELKDGLGGTPKPPRKMGIQKRGTSQSRVIEKEMVLAGGGSRLGNTILHSQKNQSLKSKTALGPGHARGKSSIGFGSNLTDQMNQS